MKISYYRSREIEKSIKNYIHLNFKKLKKLFFPYIITYSHCPY